MVINVEVCSKSPGSSLSNLDKTVDAFKDTKGNAVLELTKDPISIVFDRLGVYY